MQSNNSYNLYLETFKCSPPTELNVLYSGVRVYVCIEVGGPGFLHPDWDHTVCNDFYGEISQSSQAG